MHIIQKELHGPALSQMLDNFHGVPRRFAHGLVKGFDEGLVLMLDHFLGGNLLGMLQVFVGSVHHFGKWKVGRDGQHFLQKQTRKGQGK